MQVPFVGPSYTDRSVNMNAQRCLNFYTEIDQSGKNVIALYNTPGLTLKATCAAAAEVRGLWTASNVTKMYIVCGAKLYSSDISYTLTEIATLNTTTGPISWAENPTQVMLVDGADGWIITKAANTAAQITDPNFPATALSCAFIDGYFVVIEANNSVFYISDVNDGTAWDALDFASAESFPDAIKAVVSYHEELWLFGGKTIEIWHDNGAADFPFEEIPGTAIEMGLVAYASVAKIDNSIFWLGGNTTGEGMVYKAEGYSPKRISNHALEFAIQSYTTITDALGWCEQQDGHSFYWLTFPTEDKTWCYDVASNMWHERGWRDPNDGEIHRHRANCYTLFFNGVHIVGDWEDGRIYALNMDTFDDDGDPILSLRASGHIFDKEELRTMFHHRLQVDLEAGVGLASGQGSDPQIMLRWSDDGGHTWSGYHYADVGSFAAIGSIGQYKTRAIWNRLGQSRDRVYEISITDPVKRVIIGANLKATMGTS